MCPWNRFAQGTAESDFAVRNGLDSASLSELFAWTEADFHERLAGSAIHRIGYERWLRNLAVGLGNALKRLGDTPEGERVRSALEERRDDPLPLVREHVAWGLSQCMHPRSMKSNTPARQDFDGGMTSSWTRRLAAYGKFSSPTCNTRLNSPIGLEAVAASEKVPKLRASRLQWGNAATTGVQGGA